MATQTTCESNYKFSGYERDAETGLDYAIARYYNSRLGRFMSADPMGGRTTDPQSLNRYAYVGNAPINSSDPSGMYVMPCSAYGICDWGGDGGFGGDGGDPSDGPYSGAFGLGSFGPGYGASFTYISFVPDPWATGGDLVGLENWFDETSACTINEPDIDSATCNGGFGGGGASSSRPKLILRAESDCLGGAGREINYTLVLEGPGGSVTDALNYTVTEHLMPRNSNQSLNLLTGSTTSQPPQQPEGFSGFTDSIGGLANQDNLQTFTATSTSGGSSINVFVQDINGNDFGTERHFCLEWAGVR